MIAQYVPVCTFSVEYSKRTAVHRKSYKSESTSTIGRWIKAILEQSGVDTEQFKAHSTRSASASQAFLSGVPISKIRSLANWSNESTFSKFYRKNLICSSDEDVGQITASRLKIVFWEIKVSVNVIFRSS